jgi:non-lysosomal glucosylceramidase
MRTSRLSDRRGSHQISVRQACGLFLLVGFTTFALLVGAAPNKAAQGPELPGFRPGPTTGLEKLVPPEKNFSADWLADLTRRGQPEWYQGEELRWIGLPVGGICAGQVYLGGDGRLWHWDIFNLPLPTGPGLYANPPEPSSPIEQGFAVAVEGPEGLEIRPLDRRGFRQIRFRGEYPIGIVEYRDPDCPMAVRLEAFSPFIPLAPEDSALPVTVVELTLENLKSEPLSCRVAAWLENPVGKFSGVPQPISQKVEEPDGLLAIEHTCQKTGSDQPPRPDVLFEDFERSTYDPWTVEGDAFGTGPVLRSQIPSYQGDVGGEGLRVINSHASAPGATVAEKDSHTGVLTSPPFKIERDFIHLYIGGGAHADRTCVQLLVEDQVVASLTGSNDNRMRLRSFFTRPWLGRTARLRVVDRHSGSWGNIGVDHILLSDRQLESPPDEGSMVLGLLQPQKLGQVKLLPQVPQGALPEVLFRLTEESPLSGNRPHGAIVAQTELPAKDSLKVIFAVGWHFPNLRLELLPPGRYYARRFSSAREVLEYLAREYARLAGHTRLWRDTWYDSTLPYWLLDRTFLNTSILASSTCYWLGNGRFYAWEGVGCCPGTCTHVWLYAQAVARLFPQLERSLREMVDFGVAFDPASGRIRFRAEHNNHWAADGQAGCILRAYREHLISIDDQFLRRLWPRMVQALQFLASRDLDGDGILDGPQHNTLDADWFGQSPWLSSMYLAALRAGEEMALCLDDPGFAQWCRQRFLTAQKSIDTRLFNGEFYVHIPDPDHREAIGSYNGCHIDQILGQAWAWQVGLGHILNPTQIRSALQSLWRFNVTPDVGPYRQAFPQGRWFALPDEGGVIMCTWPYAPVHRVQKGFDFYFNECMNGFEYFLASHMIAEGMLQEGLAITRLVHERYHPLRRNPYNEIECGAHYARSMASYAVFLAVCGFHYDGPRGFLAFAPRVTPEDFRAAFTAAEGWGSFTQQYGRERFTAKLELRWGKLRLRTFQVEVPPGWVPARLEASLRTDGAGNNGGADSAALPAQLHVADRQVRIDFPDPLLLQAGQTLELLITPQ